MSEFITGSVTGSGMPFLIPADYHSFNSSHTRLNETVLSKSFETRKRLERSDHVLDFGCGTGETTVKILREGIVGTPGSVTGVDLSEAMIDYCKRNYSQIEGLEFHRADVENVPGTIRNCWKEKFSLVTSYSVLHWIEDHPTVLRFFHSILKPGGTLSILLPLTQHDDNLFRVVFEEMRRGKWGTFLNKYGYPHYGTKSRNDHWKTNREEVKQ